MIRALLKFLSLAVLSVLLLPLSYGEDACQKVETEDELFEVLEKDTWNMGPGGVYRLGMKIRSRWLRRNLHCKSMLLTQTSGIVCTPLGDRRTVRITLSYDNDARIVAAYKNPLLRSELTEEELASMKEAERRVKKLVHPGMSRYQILEALHDDLLSRVTYVYGFYDPMTMLLENKGVCAAYTRSMFVLLNMAGVPCRGVGGKVKGRGLHAWNMVKMEDGEWYHVDATWNDRGNGDVPQGRAYMCLTDEELLMKSIRRWNKELVPPSSKLGAYWYRETGRYFTDFDSLWKAAEAACFRGEREFDAYLTCYGSKKTLKKSFELYKAERGNRKAGWEFTDYYQANNPAYNKPAALRLYLRHMLNNKPFIPEPDEDDLPVEEDVSWVSDSMWEELSEIMDAEELKTYGVKWLNQKKESAGKSVEEWRKKGSDTLDAWKRKWLQTDAEKDSR